MARDTIYGSETWDIGMAELEKDWKMLLYIRLAKISYRGIPLNNMDVSNFYQRKDQYFQYKKDETNELDWLHTAWKLSSEDSAAWKNKREGSTTNTRIGSYMMLDWIVDKRNRRGNKET